MERGENLEPPRFCTEVNVPKGGRKLAVLRATLQSVVEATVDLHYKTVCCKQIFADVNIFTTVLSKNDFKNYFSLFYF